MNLKIPSEKALLMKITHPPGEEEHKKYFQFTSTVTKY